MRLPGKKTLLLVGAATALAVVALVAVLRGEDGVAVLCAVTLQALTLIVILGGRRGQAAAAAAAAADQAKAMASLDRQIANVGLRVVTEARATERAIRAGDDEEATGLAP